MEDIRWHQRFSNYRKALEKLANNIDYIKKMYDIEEAPGNAAFDDIAHGVEDIFKQGLIQSFEFTHELAWNVMKDFAKDQGNSEIRGSKDAVRYAAQVDLINDAHVWMEMIQSRNETSHTYNEAIANEIFLGIITMYYPLLKTFETKIETIRSGEQGELF